MPQKSWRCCLYREQKAAGGKNKYPYLKEHHMFCRSTHGSRGSNGAHACVGSSTDGSARQHQLLHFCFPVENVSPPLHLHVQHTELQRSSRGWSLLQELQLELYQIMGKKQCTPSPRLEGCCSSMCTTTSPKTKPWHQHKAFCLQAH